jgi:hypothetical protein
MLVGGELLWRVNAFEFAAQVEDHADEARTVGVALGKRL